MTPTGVALRDAREQLFDAAERVLLRSGPSALTSRAVTTEAGCAKGVLHRHFVDFDTFLAELVQDRIGRIEAQAAALRESAGAGDQAGGTAEGAARTVTGNLADALTMVFGSVALEIVALIISRDELRARLRRHRPTGLPLMTEAVAMLAGYLAAERDLGRIAADADVDMLARTLIGTGHLLFAGREGDAPDVDEVRWLVISVIGGVVQGAKSL
jgi:AcrR family transcriptional regulator